MANVLPALSSAQAFPRHRVRKLLNNSEYNCLSTEIEAEAVFIQLAEDGFPMRQVFLAVTRKEFFIVKQEIPEVIHVVRPGNDTEISDLAVDEILPLPVISFLIFDDSAKFFSICTNNGARYRFEMCRLDHESEQLWEKWRDSILHFGGDCKSNDVSTWRTSYVIDLRPEFDTHPEMTRIKIKSAKTRPLGRHSIGVQTEKELKNSDNYSNLVASRDKRGKLVTGNEKSETAKRGKEPQRLSDTLAERDTASSRYSSNEFRIGYRPSDRLVTLFTGPKFRQNSDIQGPRQPKLRTSRSLNDLLDSQCQSCDMQSIDPLLLRKLSNARQNVLSRKNKSVDFGSSSESEDEDLDKLFEAANTKMKHNKADGRSGRELWGLVRKSVVEKRKINMMQRFQSVVKQVHFRTLSNRNKALAQSIIEFDPIDVSLQLTNISRKLFLAVSPRDLDIFTRSRGREIRRPLREILKFTEDIRKIVVTETIKSDSRPGSVRALKFFVQVALNLLFRHHDFQSLIAVLRALTSLPLYRLGNMWATFFVQESFSFCHFLTMIQLLSPTKDHAAYVSRVNTCITRKSQFIPLLDHILEHCLKRLDCKQERLLSVNIRHGGKEKSKEHKKKKTKGDGNKFLKGNSKDGTIVPLLRPVRRDGELISLLPDKKESFKKQKNTNSCLKSILVHKDKRRHFFNSKLSGRKKKKRKYHVTFQLDSDIEERHTRKGSNEMIKHLAKTRVRLTDTAYIEARETDNDHGSPKDNEYDKNTGSRIEKPMQEQQSSLSSVDRRLTIPPSLMYYCNNKAKNILDSGIREAGHLILNGGMSADSKEESSNESKSSSIGTLHDDRIHYKNDGLVLNEDDMLEIHKIYLEEDITSEKNIEENSISDFNSENYHNTSELKISGLSPYNKLSNEKDIGRQYSDSGQENEVKDQVKENNIKESVTGHKAHKTVQETSFKTKTSTKDKLIQKLLKLKKSPPFLDRLKKKFGRPMKADIEHINALQKEIDEIADLMSSFKIFDEERDENETNLHTNSSNDDDDTSVHSSILPETSRRKSYVPGIVERGRRKSMFEEAIENREEEDEKEAELFESLKTMNLDRLKKRGSTALGLLAPDALNGPDSNGHDGKGSLKEYFTNLFKGNNKSNNFALEMASNTDFGLLKRNFKRKSLIRRCLKLGPSSNREAESFRVRNCSRILDVSTQTLQNNNNQNSSNSLLDVINVIQSQRYKDIGFANDLRDNGCSLCGNKKCLYESGIGNHVINAQTNVLKVGIPSRQRVKECLRSVITINNYLSDFDILQLSLSSE